MTNYEKIVVTAYTGVVMCEMDDLQRYAREKLGRPVWTHELALKSVIDEISKAAGGYHEGGCGWDPNGNFCGECSDSDCGQCPAWRLIQQKGGDESA